MSKVSRENLVPYVETGVEPGGPSLTKHSMAPATDINQIVARHIAHDAPLFEDGRARYGDFTGFGDYHAAFNSVKHAEREFFSLPASVRSACQNDPGIFLTKVFSEEGRRELSELGMPDLAVPENALPVPPVPAPGGEPGASGEPS